MRASQSRNCLEGSLSNMVMKMRSPDFDPSNNDLLEICSSYDVDLPNSQDPLFHIGSTVDENISLPAKTQTHSHETRHLESPTVTNHPSETLRSALDGIESILASCANGLLNGEHHLTIRLARAPSSSDMASFDLDNNTVLEEPSYRCLHFPGKTLHEAWMFSTAIRVLQLLQSGLIHDQPSTKRDIFYKDPALFAKQTVVDRLVDDIARTLQLSRSSLNVISTAKGLMAGALCIKRYGTSVGFDSQNQEGSAIPVLTNADILEAARIRWVLVIEKETIFRKVLISKLWPEIAKKGLMITAKGYPDRLTRIALNFIYKSAESQRGTKIPVYALVDFDPDGMGILHTYKFGSATLAHENLILNVPHLKWLGMKSEDLPAFVGMQTEQELLTLSLRDRRKAVSMLKWKNMREQEEDSSLRLELQRMLLLNVKAEIEILESKFSGLASYLTRRIIE